MQTEKLFYADCHAKTFSANVLRCEPRAGVYEVVLDQTAFYPEGGGQPGDTGKLGAVRVTDTREAEGEILHICDGPLCPGEEVAGEIDWQRRFDFMQQHTAEHILSGFIHKKYGYHNNGFHIGADTVTVDFDGPIPQEDIGELENLTNQVIFENRPLQCWYPAEAELPNIAYRTKRELPWPVRIVDVPGADCCACCGVHVSKTGEVGLMKILSMVKFHQGVRMEIVCGGRALSYFQRVWEQNRQVSQTFSVKPLETGDGARKINEQLGNEKYRIGALENRLFSLIAQGYQGEDNVIYEEENLTPANVRNLAEKIGQVCTGTAAVISGSDETGYHFCLISNGLDVQTLGREVTKELDGRGGGKAGAFQGTLKGTKEEILTFFRERKFVMK